MQNPIHIMHNSILKAKLQTVCLPVLLGKSVNILLSSNIKIAAPFFTIFTMQKSFIL